MTRKETLVLNVTPEMEVTYKGQAIAFYDAPYILKDKEGKEYIAKYRLYISVDNIGRKDTFKGLAAEWKIKAYERAYNLYLEARKSGGKLDETSKLIDSLADKNKAIALKDKEASSKDEEIKELHRKIAEFEAKKVTKETPKSE